MAGQAAYILKEVDQEAHAGLADGGHLDEHIGHTAVHMGQHHAPHGLVCHKGERLASQEVQAVNVLRVVGDQKLALGSEIDHGLAHEALALLDILAHGVQVCGVLQAGGEQALALLALALAVELFPPLGEEAEAGLVAGQHLHLLAALVQGVAGGGVPPCGVVQSGDGQLRHGLGRAVHQSLDVDPGHSDGQQAHSGEDRVPAADGVGHHELLIALGIRQALQRAPGFVSGGIDALPGALLAVLLLQHPLENAEGDGGLGGGAGLGDHVDRKVPVTDEGDGLQQGVSGQSVSGEEDVGGVLLLQIVIGGAQELDDRAGAQIGTANANDHQHLGLLLDLPGSRLDPGELLFVIVPGQRHPAGKITAGSAVGGQHLRRLLQAGLPAGQIILGKEAVCIGQIECQHRKILL